MRGFWVHLRSHFHHASGIAALHEPRSVSQFKRVLRMWYIAHANEHHGRFGEERIVEGLNVVERIVVDADDGRIFTVVAQFLRERAAPIAV